MIAFNGQYLDQASHGNMRITAACLGGQWVIGGKWLTPATQQAIIAAFGAEEGIAVISRTNDYLNALVLTDTQRAQQLAMFINEDPLLVTSLVETSKTRWLVGDGVARIELGTMTLTAEAEIEADIMATKNGWNTPFGLNSWGSGYGIFYNQDYTIRPWWANNNYNSTIAGCTWVEETRSHIKMKAGYFENNGTVYYNQAVTKTNQTAMFYLYRCGGNSNFFKGGLGAVRLQDKSQGVDFHLCPFIRNGENGMLDIISGTFHPNANTAGAFTIAITDKQ